MRTARVLIPRSVSQQSKALGMAPSAFWENLSFSWRSSRFITSAPPSRSACPPMYFVVLWTTRSTPSASGFCRAGDANVLSHTLIASCALARTASSRRSTTFIKGFVGDCVLGVDEVSEVDECRLDPVVAHDSREDAIDPAVAVVRHDDVVSFL